MKRTNPKKGLDVDPQWTEITWEEALDTIVAQLGSIRDDPKKLWIQGWESVGDGLYWVKAFGSAFAITELKIDVRQLRDGVRRPPRSARPVSVEKKIVR